MMQMILRKRCVFNYCKSDKPPTEPINESLKVVKNIENKDKVETKNDNKVIKKEPIVTEVKQNKKIEIQEPDIIEDLGLKPKRKGNLLFTVTSNVKTPNKRYVVTKIIEEKNEKMAKIMYEKSLKNSLGKIRNMTKMTITEYKVGDSEHIEEIVERKTTVNEPKELTLFEKALEVLCTSPHIHLYKTPLVSGKKSAYLIAASMEDFVDKIKEIKEDAEKKFNEMQNILDDNDLDVEFNDSAFYKIVKKTRELTGAEIKSDKNAIKAIGKRDEEDLKAIIKIHEDEEYRKEHRFDIAKNNIKKLMKVDNMKIYNVYIEGFKKESSQFVIATESGQAMMLARYNEIMNDFISEKIDKGELDKATNKVVSAHISFENDEDMDKHLKSFLEKENACVQALTDLDFTPEKWISFLDKIDTVLKMTEEERGAAVKSILNSGLIQKEKVNKLIEKAINGRIGGKFEKLTNSTI